MKKIILTIIIFLIFPISVYALDYPKVNSKVVEVYDINDDKVLYEIDSEKKSSVASLTKIATVITAIENIDDLNKEVTITSEILNTVSWQAKRTGLRRGDKVTYKDLLYAAMLNSGADAAHSIAILSAGSVEGFVNKMNELSKKLGLENTHFANVVGLDDENNYSTASDIRKLLVYALKNKEFREIFSTKTYKLSNGITVKASLYNYKADENAREKVIGSKTGITGNAGYCLSTLSNINGHEIIIITLNAEKEGNKAYHVIDTMNLINYLSENYKEEIISEKGLVVATIPVKLSNDKTYEIKTTQDIKKFINGDFNKEDLKIEYEGVKELDYTNQKDEKIGKIKYYLGTDLIFEENVIINKSFKLDLIKLIKKNILFIIGIYVIILSTLLLINKKKHKKRKKS